MLIKHWLVLLVCLGFAVLNGKPGFAGGAMFERAPAGSFGGFGWNSPVRAGVPTMRLPPAGPGMTIARQGFNPAPRTAPMPIVPELGGRDEVSPATRSAGMRPVEPRTIVIDSSGGPKGLTSTGSATAAHPVPQSAGPKVLIVSDTIGSRSMEPKIIEVNPATGFKPFRPKVIVANPSLISRHRGRTVIGIVEGAQGTILLLGSPCDLGVSLADSCAPADSALLIIEAAPEDAQVFLDGQLLGTAGQLAGQAVAITAGPHALAIVSPQAEPFIAQFTAKPGIPTRIHVALAAR
jgi:hypothetical protein